MNKICLCHCHDVHNVSDQWLVRLCPNMNVVVCAFIGLCCFM